MGAGTARRRAHYATRPTLLSCGPQVYAYMRQYREAERAFDRAISLSPLVSSAYYDKAILYLSWHESPARAEDVLREATAQAGPTILLSVNPARRPIVITLVRLFPDEYGRVLRSTGAETSGVDGTAYFLAKAEYTSRTGAKQLADVYYDSARVVLEVKEPESAWGLGLAYAGLGSKSEAIREGRNGVAAVPVSRDAHEGPTRLWQLAMIYGMVGEYDAAIEQLEHLLSIPSDIGPGLLRVDPLWEPVRNDPRFQRLLGQAN